MFVERYFRKRDKQGKLIPPAEPIPEKPARPATLAEARDVFIGTMMRIGAKRDVAVAAWERQLAKKREGKKA